MRALISFLTILTATCLAPSVVQAQNAPVLALSPAIDCGSCWVRIHPPGEYSLDGSNFSPIPENGRVLSRCLERMITVRESSSGAEIHEYHRAVPNCCNRGPAPWRQAVDELWGDQDRQNDELRRLAEVDGLQDERADDMARDIQQNRRDLEDHEHPALDSPRDDEQDCQVLEKENR